MEQIATWIAKVTKHVSNERLPENKKERAAFVKAFTERMQSDTVLASIATEVQNLCGLFPLV